MRGDKFDLNWRGIHDPITTFQGFALVTDTPTQRLYAILWSTINQTTRVIHASNRRTSKNKINKNSICIHESWGLESSRMGGLADTRVYKEVAAAKVTIKQNPICLWRLWRNMTGWRMTKGMLWSCSNPRTRPYWAQLDT
jgi:hypothetical protein